MPNIRNKQINACLLDLNGISSLSALKYFPLVNLAWRSRLNQVGTFQYTNTAPKHPKNQRTVDSIFDTNVKRANNSIPVIAEAKITFLSLLKKLGIESVLELVFYIFFSVSQNLKKVLQIIVLSTIFCASFASAVAENECLNAITKYEQLYSIPKGLLKAVSKVESAYNPLALNDGLKQHKFKNKQEAIERITYLQSIGKTNFDVGCMQINYRWHYKNFTSVEEMLDVDWNVRYAASHLYGLYKEHESWQIAIRYYHSYDPEIHKKYSKKIAIAWLKGD